MIKIIKWEENINFSKEIFPTKIIKLNHDKYNPLSTLWYQQIVTYNDIWIISLTENSFGVVND